MPAGGVPDPNLAALTCALVLVLVVGFSALNAALVSGVLYLALSAVRREGGARGAARAVAQRVAELSLRVGLTPAQFGFLLIAAAVLVWNLWLRGGSSSSYGGSSSYGRRGYSSSSSRGYGGGGYGDDGYGGGYSGLGSQWDLGFMLSAGMLGMYVWNLGGGGRPGGWSVGNVVHRVQNMDFFQLMMLMNMVQNVLGGRRRGYGGGYGRGFGGGFGRRMYY